MGRRGRSIDRSLNVCLLTSLYSDQKRDSTTETIKMAPNIPYEYRQPMKFKINLAYDDVKL